MHLSICDSIIGQDLGLFVNIEWLFFEVFFIYKYIKIIFYLFF